MRHTFVLAVALLTLASVELAAGAPAPFVSKKVSPAALFRATHAPGASIPITLRLERAPTPADVAALEALGLVVSRRARGEPRGRGRLLVGRTDAAGLAGFDAAPLVSRVSLDVPLVEPPPPLDVTAAEVGASALWRERVGAPAVTGAGITLCNLDTGIDALHPSFFRADAGYHDWLDVDGDGAFTRAVDAVDLDGDGGAGPGETLLVLDIPAFGLWSTSPLPGSDAPDLAVGLDYLYADTDGSGARERGADAGFTEEDPAYGEPLFAVDDVDGNGRLDPGERLVRLGTSKVARVRLDADEYVRGEDLVGLPPELRDAHGTASSAILAGGQPGLSRLVGMAPDAEILLAIRTGDAGFTELTDWCIEHGARVILHEYAPWVGYHFDGSSDLERLLDLTTLEGVVHVNPAGNLRTGDKLTKRPLAAGTAVDIPLLVPAETGASDFFLTVLWRDVGRDLKLSLTDPDGVTKEVPGEVSAPVPWTPVAALYGMRELSDRGTAAHHLYFYGPSDAPAPTGTWTLSIADPSSPAAGDVELFVYVMDDASGWAKGVHFPELASDAHLVGWPGTADLSVAVSAYTGHSMGFSVAGELAHYTGRGRRIDGYPLLSVAAPDNPLAADYLAELDVSYRYFGGTSGASPHVAGAAALLLSAHPELDGVGVRDRLRASALADEHVGDSPNDDWGYGKLRVHRALYGVDPDPGAPPSVTVNDATGHVGVPLDVPIVATDAEDGLDELLVQVDLDYDGTFETLPVGAAYRPTLHEVGTRRLKVQVTDSSGQSASALATLTVTDPPPPAAALPLRLELRGGGGCATRGERGAPAAAAALVVTALFALSARRRRRPPRARRA